MRKKNISRIVLVIIVILIIFILIYFFLGITFGIRADKPIIYLYPEKDITVEVKLGYEDKLTTTYPKYKGSWNVFAKRDGSLVDLDTGRSLYALYWDVLLQFCF